MGLFTKEQITFWKLFWIVILTLSWCESLILPFVNAKLFQIRLLKCREKGILDCDPPTKPNFEDLWTQSSFGSWFASLWTGPLPRSVQILFVIGMAVNTPSSNHKTKLGSGSWSKRTFGIAPFWTGLLSNPKSQPIPHVSTTNYHALRITDKITGTWCRYHTSASWSNRPNSSFSVLTNSGGEHSLARAVKPTMSAYRMLGREGK